MKKTYIAPEMEIEEVVIESLMQISIPANSNDTEDPSNALNKEIDDDWGY